MKFSLMQASLFQSRVLCRPQSATVPTIPGFYKSAAILFVSLLIMTLIVGFFCFEQTYISERLLPAPRSFLPWKILVDSDADANGQSTVQINDSEQSLDFSFTLSDKVQYSFVSAALLFNHEDAGGSLMDFADLSPYQQIQFNVKCAPANVLSFTLYTFDEKFTNLRDPITYRMPVTFFSCDNQWRTLTLDLQHLEIPEWWMHLHKINLSDRGYRLDKVSRMSFGVSLQSPRNVLSSVNINGIALKGRDWRLAYVFALLATVFWLAYGFWFFRQHLKILASQLREQLQKERPLIAYQQLSVEPHRDKEKNSVLRYMATEYANPDISLESAISAIGINRAKMNHILKDEVGLTFSAYLNKLRLTEAARLLSEKPEANVAEIAFSVGYNNVSYFNKLFKNEYGCSPKTFKFSDTQKDTLKESPDPDNNLSPANNLVVPKSQPPILTKDSQM